MTAKQTLRLTGGGSVAAGTVFHFRRGAHTPLYASQQQKDGGDPDLRDDVHALGVIGYQMQTGHLSVGPVPDFTDDLRDAGADEEFIGLIGRCMSNKPKRRPAHAGEVLATLTKSATTPAVAANPVSPPPPAAKPQRKAGDRLDLPLPNGLKMAFAWCPPGNFLMGGGIFTNEEPRHEVIISKGFYMGVHPVTQAEWREVMGSDPSYFKGDRRPVEQVSWDNAVAFCKELTTFTGKSVRLPTEAEWEYACRAGTSTAFWYGDIPNAERMNYRGDRVWNGSVAGTSREQTTDIATFAANPWGLCDTHGNVWEWCQDYWDEIFYRHSQRIDPVNSINSAQHVQRGGGWSTIPEYCRSARRDSGSPGNISKSEGFRACFHLD